MNERLGAGVRILNFRFVSLKDGNRFSKEVRSGPQVTDDHRNVGANVRFLSFFSQKG